ncbi:WecB/TagA/CpsF family glycosyltransferase [Desulfomarina profundi]|nr:WecB/TagA/CpsF family glycosyltransferase [Desulfomarina profundi]
METFDIPEFKTVVNNADLVVPDGVPLVWALKALGEKTATQVRGSDLLLHLCRESEKSGIPIGLYGGTPDSLNDFRKFLKNEYSDLKITFSYSPPFRELTQEEQEKYVREIRASGCSILFVGIGCPKQEKWMAGHRDKIPCVMIGVGAAFDFFSGRKKHAPRWMQKAGLEWLFRLASDPRRLWKRYLKHNPRFIYYFGKQYIRYRFGRNEKV